MGYICVLLLPRTYLELTSFRQTQKKGFVTGITPRQTITNYGIHFCNEKASNKINQSCRGSLFVDPFFIRLKRCRNRLLIVENDCLDLIEIYINICTAPQPHSVSLFAYALRKFANGPPAFK